LQVKLKNANTNPLSSANFVGAACPGVCWVSSCLPPRYPLKAEWYKNKPPEKNIRKSGKMKLIEEINLPNGLTLRIFDLSRSIAADTVKVEISFQVKIDLSESFFTGAADYILVKNIFGDELTYEHKMERAFVPQKDADATRDELIRTFKNNSLNYLGKEKFAEKLALSLLRDIRNNPYKYSVCSTADMPQQSKKI
jgi:hypothetical protein